MNDEKEAVILPPLPDHPPPLPPCPPPELPKPPPPPPLDVPLPPPLATEDIPKPVDEPNNENKKEQESENKGSDNECFNFLQSTAICPSATGTWPDNLERDVLQQLPVKRKFGVEIGMKSLFLVSIVNLEDSTVLHTKAPLKGGGIFIQEVDQNQEVLENIQLHQHQVMNLRIRKL
ncbi:unnamed protein product, partial [Iphiclides podalirius]